MTYVGDYWDFFSRGVLYILVLWFRLYYVWDFPIFFEAATVFANHSAWRMLGTIEIFCRGVLYFLLLGFRLYSVWDFPIFFETATVLVKKLPPIRGSYKIGRNLGTEGLGWVQQSHTERLCTQLSGAPSLCFAPLASRPKAAQPGPRRLWRAKKVLLGWFSPNYGERTISVERLRKVWLKFPRWGRTVWIGVWPAAMDRVEGPHTGRWGV